MIYHTLLVIGLASLLHAQSDLLGEIETVITKEKINKQNAEVIRLAGRQLIETMQVYGSLVKKKEYPTIVDVADDIGKQAWRCIFLYPELQSYVFRMEEYQPIVQYIQEKQKSGDDKVPEVTKEEQNNILVELKRVSEHDFNGIRYVDVADILDGSMYVVPLVKNYRNLSDVPKDLYNRMKQLGFDDIKILGCCGIITMPVNRLYNVEMNDKGESILVTR